MVLDKRGATIFVTFMLGIVFFLIGLALAHPITQVASDSMSQLNCTTNYLTNASVTNINKAICTQFDSYAPLFVGVLFGLAGMLIGRLVL